MNHNSLTLVFYNLQKVPEEVWRGKKTVFLMGPSPRSSTAKSYREGFQTALASLDPNGEWAIFNPETENFDPTRAPDYARWESEMLEKCSVIVVGLDCFEKDTMPGLTTLMLPHRRNLVFWRPKKSLETKYIWDRAEEHPHTICLATKDTSPDTMQKLAQAVIEMHDRNVTQLDKAFNEETNTLRITPTGCDPAYLSQAILEERHNPTPFLVQICVAIEHVGLYQKTLSDLQCSFSDILPARAPLLTLGDPIIRPKMLIYYDSDTVFTFYHVFYCPEHYHGHAVLTRTSDTPPPMIERCPCASYFHCYYGPTEEKAVDSHDHDHDHCRPDYHGFCEFDPITLTIFQDQIRHDNEWYTSQQNHQFGAFKRWRYHESMYFLNGKKASSRFQPAFRIPNGGD